MQIMPNYFAGIKKKIVAKGKRSDCKILNDWIKGISNHVYWCAATSGGDVELARAKWLSIFRHVVNKHQDHGDVYVQCEHDHLEERNWLVEGLY